MTALFTLFELDEPAYMLNGRLVPAAAGAEVQVITGPDTVSSYPPLFRPALEYFTRLRTRSEALEAGGDPDLDFDAGDLAALRDAGLLWTLMPGDGTAIIEQLGEICLQVVAPLAKDQNRPGYVVLQAEPGYVAPINTASYGLLGELEGYLLGPSVEQVARAAEVPARAVWHGLVPDLTLLLRTGTAAITQGA